MNEIKDIHTMHWVRAVAQFNTVQIHFLVGSNQRVIEVERPQRFEELTLVSQYACSKRTSDLKGKGPRAVSKRALSSYGRPITAGYFFDTRFLEPNNVSHLLMDIIPLCLTVKKAVDEKVIFVFRPLQPRFRELLQVFGIEPLCTYRPVRGRRLTFYLSRGLAQYEVAGTFDTPLYSYLGEVYSDYTEESSAAGSRIFISRRGPRAPSNSDELSDFLQRRGFETVFLEDFSISEQIAIMQRADEVVAIHGAGIAFLALKTKTKALIEIMPPNVYHDHFAVGVGNKVDTFVQLIPSFDAEVQYKGWPAILESKQQAFTVDLQQLQNALDLVAVGEGRQPCGFEVEPV